MENTISPMQESDLPRVAELALQLGYPNELNQLQQRFLQLQQLSEHWTFVIRQHGLVEGWVHLEKVYDLIESDKLEIKAIVINQQMRERGLGKQLLDRAKMLARENKLKIIYLNCNIQRDRAHAFYRREGFDLIKTSHFFQIEV
jgi:N-acetylglutamate synthase-like GNAT family acetyltransferase